MISETADGRRVAAPVVVDHDDDWALGRRDVVERLPAHAAGERAVTDNRNHVPVAVAGQFEGFGHTVGVGQRRRGMAGLDPVVIALSPRRIARQTALHPQGVEVSGAPGQHLVHISLMTGVEDDRVVGRVEHAVQRQGEFHHTEVGPQVATGRRDLMDQKLADLHRQFCQLILGKVLQIGRAADLFEHFRSLPTVAGRFLPSQIDVRHTVAVRIGGFQFENRAIVPVADAQQNPGQ